MQPGCPVSFNYVFFFFHISIIFKFCFSGYKPLHIPSPYNNHPNQSVITCFIFANDRLYPSPVMCKKLLYKSIRGNSHNVFSKPSKTVMNSPCDIVTALIPMFIHYSLPQSWTENSGLQEHLNSVSGQTQPAMFSLVASGSGAELCRHWIKHKHWPELSVSPWSPGGRRMLRKLGVGLVVWVETLQCCKERLLTQKTRWTGQTYHFRWRKTKS